MMQLFLAILLASIALTASTAIEGRELDAASDLYDRWFMEEPEIAYDPINNLFTLSFNTTSSANNATLGGLEEEFYDYNCRDDGSGFVEYVIPSGITGPDGVSPPTMINGPDGFPQLIFKINTTILANDPNIYTYYDLTGP